LQGDGDIIGQLNGKFEVLPGALKLAFPGESVEHTARATH
jgi:diacylglycerol kinase family enzyme